MLVTQGVQLQPAAKVSFGNEAVFFMATKYGNKTVLHDTVIYLQGTVLG